MSDWIVTDEMVEAALAAWFSGPQSENDMGLARSMRAAITAAIGVANPAERPDPNQLFEEMIDALKSALNYIENTESELGITLQSGDKIRSTLEKASK